MIIIKEINESQINLVIALDRELSWELLDQNIKKQLGWNEFIKRHENVFKNLYKSSIGSQIILGAFDDDTLIGYAWIELRLDTVSMLPTCFIIDIGVKQNYRKKGIGKQLINKINEIAYKNNAKTISLLVDKKNKNAINFYKKAGFKITGYIMEKDITH
jgi:ribosomal protein S18 acetylase RimI-like enzyme